MISLALLFTPLGARVLGTIETPVIDVTGDQSGLRLDESADIRIGLYSAALRMLRDRPLFGYGPDNFSAAFPAYRSEAEPSAIRQSLPTSAHSWAAQTAATSGLAGLVAFVGVASLAIVVSARAGLQPVAWMGAVMLGAFVGSGITTISDVGTDWLFWVSAGAIAAATGRPWSVATATPTATSRRTSRTGRPSLLPLVISFGCVLLGLGLPMTTLGAYAASHSARDSQRQRLAGQPQLAVESALRAITQDPGRSEYWNSLGLAQISARRVSDSIPAFNRAASLAPYDVRYLGDLVNAYLLLMQRGDATSAIRALDVADRAVRADPNNPGPHLARAIVMQVRGDLPQAVRSIERALELDPKSTNEDLYATATNLMLVSGRPADAVRLARSGLAIARTVRALDMRIDLARGLYALGQREEALGQLAVVLEIQPDNPTAQELRAQILAAPPG
jgi:cytochrome c-type biogenesis protein CcmH/NrfG